MSGFLCVTVLAAIVAASNAGVLPSYPAPFTYTAPAIKTISYRAAPLNTMTYGAPIAKQFVAPVAKAFVAPVAKPVVADHFAPPHYDFSYAVHDPNTGDVKEQKESRKDDVVHGMYSLIEADGSRRIVEYTADDHNGFQAIVHREPAAHPVAVKAIAPVLNTFAAPVAAVKYAAPIAAVKYAAPTATYVSYSAPTHIYHH